MSPTKKNLHRIIRRDKIRNNEYVFLPDQKPQFQVKTETDPYSEKLPLS